MLEPEEETPENTNPADSSNYCEDIGEIVRLMNSRSFPLRVEYEKMREYCDTLENAAQRRSERQLFFSKR